MIKNMAMKQEGIIEELPSITEAREYAKTLIRFDSDQ